MAFDWFHSSQKVNQLIAKQKYPQAVAQLEKSLKKDPENLMLMKQLGDLLPKAGRPKEGMAFMEKVADSYLDDGFFMKALAQLKKMKRLDPDNISIQDKIASLVEQQQGPPSNSYKTVDFSPKEEEQDDVQLDANPKEIVAEPAPTRLIQSPLFDDFSDEELKDFIESLELKSYHAGDILFSEGEPGDSLMVLANGLLKVYVTNLGGRNEMVRLLHEGDFFGEISLLSRKPRTATITCASDCELLELNRKTLVELSKTHPEIPKTLKAFYQERALSPEEMDARCGE